MISYRLIVPVFTTKLMFDCRNIEDFKVLVIVVSIADFFCCSVAGSAGFYEC